MPRLRCHNRLMNFIYPALHKSFLVLLLAVLCSACAVQPRTTDIDPDTAVVARQDTLPAPRVDLFDAVDPIASFDQMIQLTPEQEDAFLDWFHAPHRATTGAHQRVADYLQTRLTGVLFDHQTRSAAEALTLGRGNCLSLALVTTAVANLAGIESDWRLTRNFPIYSADGDIVFSANHVHMRLYDPDFVPDPGRITLMRPLLLIDYFTEQPSRGGQTLEAHELAALIYQNLAAEALAERDLSAAFAHTMEGLAFDPDNAELYNILGLLHQRNQEWVMAEAYFRHALALEENRMVTLRNLEALLNRMGRSVEADQIARQIRSLPDSDPFPLIQAGDEAVAQGHWNTALRYYRRAQNVAPYMPKLQSRIALLEMRRGERRTVELFEPAAMAKATPVPKAHVIKGGLPAHALPE